MNKFINVNCLKKSVVKKLFTTLFSVGEICNFINKINKKNNNKYIQRLYNFIIIFNKLTNENKEKFYESLFNSIKYELIKNHIYDIYGNQIHHISIIRFIELFLITLHHITSWNYKTNKAPQPTLLCNEINRFTKLFIKSNKRNRLYKIKLLFNI